MRVAVRAIERADLKWAEQEMPASFRERYARSRPDYRLSEEEREKEILEAGGDGLWLLGLVEAAREGIRCLEELGILRRVWEQRYERVGGEVMVRQEMVEATELIVTPHDAGVRVGHKRGVSWMGEKVHVSETAERDVPNFITDVTTAGASSGDLEALGEIRGRLGERGVMPAEQYVDSGYVSGKVLSESEEAGITLMGPPLPDTSKQEFKIADFEIDRGMKRAICPEGKKSVGWKPC